MSELLPGTASLVVAVTVAVFEIEAGGVGLIDTTTSQEIEAPLARLPMFQVQGGTFEAPQVSET